MSQLSDEEFKTRFREMCEAKSKALDESFNKRVNEQIDAMHRACRVAERCVRTLDKRRATLASRMDGYIAAAALNKLRSLSRTITIETIWFLSDLLNFLVIRTFGNTEI